MFQGFQIQLEQDVGVQNTVLHTFQQHDGVIVKIVLFEFQIVIFRLSDMGSSLGFVLGFCTHLEGCFGGQRINLSGPSDTLEKSLDLQGVFGP